MKYINIMNFRDFEDLINSQTKVLSLNDDVILDDDENYEKGIEINTEGLSIDGNGHAIDAGSRAKAFNIQSDNVRLLNLTFRNCVSHEGNGGGAIENWGNHLALKHCNFDNNNSYSGGGAIYSFKDMDLADCIFKSNASIESDGGAIFLDSSDDCPIKVVLKNCSFKNNCADGQFKDFGSNAGAIYNKKADLSLFNCNFEDNGVVSAYMSDSESILNEDGLISLDNCYFKTVKSHSIFNRGLLIVNDCGFCHDFESGFEIPGSIFNRGSVALPYGKNSHYNVELNGRTLDSSNIKDLINEYEKVYDSDMNEERIIFKKNRIESGDDFKRDNFKDCEYLESFFKNNMDIIVSGDF